MIQLSTWNILHKDLVPLILTYGHNQHLLYQAVKLVAFLTLPGDKVACNIQEQNRALLNGLRILIENHKIFAIILGLLIEPLQQLESIVKLKNNNAKSIQVVLTLFRNILIIADEEDSMRVKQSLSYCLVKYNFLDMLLVLVQNHKKVLIREDTALTIEILQLLFRGIHTSKLAVKISSIAAENIREHAWDDLKKGKFQMTRFKGKFENKDSFQQDKIHGKKRSSNFFINPAIHSKLFYFSDENKLILFWRSLLESTYFGAFVYHAWKDIVRSSGDVEHRATEWQTRCYNFLDFTILGLRILSKLLLQQNRNRRSVSIEAVADIFESSFIHWLRMEWISFENRKDYHGASLVCSLLVEITSILRSLSNHANQIEKDVSKFLIHELYFKSRKESLLEQACLSLKNLNGKLPSAYSISLVHILNSSLKIIECQENQLGLIEYCKYGNFYTDSTIFSHLLFIMNSNFSHTVLESVFNYVRVLINTGYVEKLFTYRHLDCLQVFAMASKNEFGPYFELGSALQKVFRFVLTCFLTSITRPEFLKSGKKEFFIQILFS
jgi:hypothetical protein